MLPARTPSGKEERSSHALLRECAGLVIILVRDLSISPRERSRQWSHKPAIVRAGERSRAVKTGLFAARRVLRLVISQHRNQATIALERLTKEWLLSNSFGPRIEGRQPQFLDRAATSRLGLG
jgi:hypothetical protein